MYRLLAQFDAPQVFNPWADRDPLDRLQNPAALRLRRLRRHFATPAAFLLIGEAAGYQGCHFSGIAFTSERLLLEGSIPRVTCPERATRRVRPWSEPSATTVWKCLHEFGIAERTVLWNAFPWHPHLPGNPYSNRRPSPGELRLGLRPLRAVLKRFSGARVVAVGRIAAQLLGEVLGAEPACVRHPSMAGASRFRSELGAWLRL
jgi:hypothetical protein